MLLISCDEILFFCFLFLIVSREIWNLFRKVNFNLLFLFFLKKKSLIGSPFCSDCSSSTMVAVTSFLLTNV